jgi:hypothetical protein
MRSPSPEGPPGRIRRLGRASALVIGLAMAGFGNSAGWNKPRVQKPPIELSRDGDEHPQPVKITVPKEPRQP